MIYSQTVQHINIHYDADLDKKIDSKFEKQSFIESI